jgi:hypothetical protein
MLAQNRMRLVSRYFAAIRVVLSAYFWISVRKKTNNGVFWQLPACGAQLTACSWRRRAAVVKKRRFLSAAGWTLAGNKPGEEARREVGCSTASAGAEAP